MLSSASLMGNAIDTTRADATGSMFHRWSFVPPPIAAHVPESGYCGPHLGNRKGVLRRERASLMIETDSHTKISALGNTASHQQSYELLSITAQDTEGLLVRMIVALCWQEEKRMSMTRYC
jgi:hypothetical protein